MVQNRMNAKMANVHSSKIQSGKPAAIAHKTATKAQPFKSSPLSAVLAGTKKGQAATQQPRVSSVKAKATNGKSITAKSAPTSYGGKIVNLK